MVSAEDFLTFWQPILQQNRAEDMERAVQIHYPSITGNEDTCQQLGTIGLPASKRFKATFLIRILRTLWLLVYFCYCLGPEVWKRFSQKTGKQRTSHQHFLWSPCSRFILYYTIVSRIINSSVCIFVVLIK